MNYIFFKVHRFKGNAEEYHDIKNSCISQVLENRTGNPVSLGHYIFLDSTAIKHPCVWSKPPSAFCFGV